MIFIKFKNNTGTDQIFEKSEENSYEIQSPSHTETTDKHRGIYLSVIARDSAGKISEGVFIYGDQP